MGEIIKKKCLFSCSTDQIYTELVITLTRTQGTFYNLTKTYLFLTGTYFRILYPSYWWIFPLYIFNQNLFFNQRDKSYFFLHHLVCRKKWLVLWNCWAIVITLRPLSSGSWLHVSMYVVTTVPNVISHCRNGPFVIFMPTHIHQGHQSQYCVFIGWISKLCC